MKQTVGIMAVLTLCLAPAWAGRPATTAPAVSPYEDGRLLSDFSVREAAAARGGLRAGITIHVYASSAPNAYGSPSWAGYVTKALSALENELAVNGDRATDPTGYERAPAVVAPGEIAVTSFNSWRGVVGPPPPFANEYGNRMHFGLHAYGDGVTKFALNDLTFALHSSDPWDSLVYVGDFVGYDYNGTTRYGIDWGTNGVKGGGDDIVHTSGNGTTLVDEIVYVGVGNAWWPSGSSPPDPQADMDDYFAWIAADGPINVTCTYAILGSTGSDSVLVEQEVVDELAEDGWFSDDTRSSTGTNLVGIKYTHYGKPGQTPTAADDVAIANQIQFVLGPGGVPALKLTKASVSSAYSKSSISAIDEAGFAADDWRAGFFADYRYYAESTAEAAVLKIGIRSPLWGTGAGQSQNGFTASRSGESAWDLVLVDWRGTQPGWTVNAWDYFNTDADTQCWQVYRQGGNGFFNALAGPAYPQIGWSLNELYTMNDLGTPTHVARAGYTWSQMLFGTGVKVTSLQFGVGSSAQTSTTYIDYLHSSLLGGNRVDFDGPTAVTVEVYPSLVPDEQQPRVTLGDAPTAFGPDSWQNSATGKVNWHARYLADGDYLSKLFLAQAATLTVNDIASIRYWTKRPGGTTAGQDWAIFLYTRKKTGGDGSWYGYRFVNNYEEHTAVGTWTQYSTDADMTFRKNSGTPTGLMDFDTLKATYGTELVEMVSVQTMSNWSGVFNGYMDGLTITLTDGSAGNVDFVRAPTLSIEPDDECYAIGETVTVGLWMHDVPESIVGGQFFLSYDTAKLTFVSAVGESPFIELYEQYPAAGQIDYAVQIPPTGSTTGDAKMAVLTFTAAAQICTATNLITWRANDPPTRLSDSIGQAVYPDPVAMDVIDDVAPTATQGTIDACYASAALANAAALAATTDLTDNCDPSPTKAVQTGAGDCDTSIVIRVTDSCGNYTDYTYTTRVDGTKPTATQGTIAACYPDAASADAAALAATTDLTDNCGATGVTKAVQTGAGDCDTSIVIRVVDSCGNFTDYPYYTRVDSTKPTATQGAIADCYPDATSADAAALAATTNLADNCGATGVTKAVQTGAGDCDTPIVIRVADSCGNFTDYTYYTRVDGTDPVIHDCPGNITVYADAGGCDAVVTWTEPTATDNCGAAMLDSDYEPGDTFPAGITLVTYTATDTCGNDTTCSFNVTVDAYNEMNVSVELSPTMDAIPISRCITFDLWKCPGTTPAATVNAVLDFNASGLAANQLVPVPCGDYDCITARDKLHTLRRTDESFGIVGTQYVADFTGDPVAGGDWLIGGNLQNDFWIDILDFGVFSWQWAVSYGTGDTTCSTAFPHADISGNGTVGTGDFTFIQVNFLKGHEANCCGQPGFRGDEEGAAGPLTRIAVSELRRQGLLQLGVADLNDDGWLDAKDITAFMSGVRPQPLPGPVPVEIDAQPIHRDRH